MSAKLERVTEFFALASTLLRKELCRTRRSHRTGPTFSPGKATARMASASPSQDVALNLLHKVSMARAVEGERNAPPPLCTLHDRILEGLLSMLTAALDSCPLPDRESIAPSVLRVVLQQCLFSRSGGSQPMSGSLQPWGSSFDGVSPLKPRGGAAVVNGSPRPAPPAIQAREPSMQSTTSARSSLASEAEYFGSPGAPAAGNGSHKSTGALAGSDSGSVPDDSEAHSAAVDDKDTSTSDSDVDEKSVSDGGAADAGSKHKRFSSVASGAADDGDLDGELHAASPRHEPAWMQLPKCKRDSTRRAAFGVLVALCRDSSTVTAILLEKLEPILEDSVKARQLAFAAQFDVDAESDQRAECGFVGLRNLGCTCYMNSLIQQLFMIPRLRYSILMAREPAADDDSPATESHGEKDESSHVSLPDSRQKGSDAAGAPADDNVEEEGEDEDDDEDDDDNLLLQLQHLFGALEMSARLAYDPRSWVHAYKDDQGCPTNPAIQQDSQEFFNNNLRSAGRTAAGHCT